jgi:hypothetical protein
MSKKIGAKKKTGLGKLVPPKRSAAPAVTSKSADAGDNEGGKHGERVTLSFRVTPTQYRKLVEMRLDERSTIHALLEKAVSYYFQHEHGTTF